MKQHRLKTPTKLKLLGVSLALVCSMTANAAPILNSTNGHYYELVNASGTFDEAVTAASKKTYESITGHLVTLNDSDEQSFIEKKLKLEKWAIYWMGGKQVSGTKQWITGETFTDLNKFAVNEPGSTDYGFSIAGDGYKYTWSGQSKTQKLGGYIIEYEKRAQTISFGSLSNKIFGDAPFDLEATASSGLTVSYTATGPCTVSGKTVMITGSGQCSIAAQQAGNQDYTEAKTVTQEFTIAKVTQIISFASPLPPTAMLGDSITLRVVGGQSGQPVKLASSTATICTISKNNILKFEAIGTCMITANQEGNNNYYNATQVKIEMSVLPKPERKTLPDKRVGEEISLKASSTSGLPVIFTLDRESRGCELQDNQVKAVSVGTCVLLVTQTGDATYYPAFELWSFNIIKDQQTTTSEKLVLGTINCKKDDPTCYDLADPTCPAIPEPCTPPSPTTTKWLYNIPPLDAKEEVTLQLINRSGKPSSIISGRAYNPEGENIGEFSLNGGQPIGKQQTLLVTKQDLKMALNHTWQDWLTLEILNAENLRAVSYLNYMISTGTEPLDIPVSGSTATSKHRLYNVPAPRENTVSIRVYNLSSKAMAFAARLFNQDGTLSNEKVFQFPELAPQASLTFLSTDLVQPKTRKTWEMDRWIEIFPVEKDRRCTGEMQLQLFMAILPIGPNSAILWQNMTLPDD